MKIFLSHRIFSSEEMFKFLSMNVDIQGENESITGKFIIE